VGNELDEKWKEVILAEFGVISRYLLEGRKPSYKNLSETVGYPGREF
jgi:hypothetical protein